jgi:superfamily II DNA/RNA helicase
MAECQDNPWASAGAPAWIVDAVLSMGFNSMTPVQKAVIPLFMGNKDVIV